MAKALEVSLGDVGSKSLLEGEYLDQMVLTAFKVVLRAVKFHDVWSEVAEQEKMVPRMLNVIKATGEVPPTPPADKDSQGFGVAAESRQPHQYNGIIANANDQFISANPEGDRIRENRERQTNSHQNISYTSWPSERSYTSQSPNYASRPSSVHTARQSFSHRVSWSAKSGSVRSGRLASERLLTAHDTFLGVLANFIGIHLSTRTSTEVLVATQQAVNAGRALLTVVEAVWDRGLCKSDDLERTRDIMYSKITELVFAAQHIFQPTSAVDNQEFDPQSKKQLADVATSCIRSAGDCVATTRYALEMIGDFEFETVGECSPFEGIDIQLGNDTDRNDPRSQHDTSVHESLSSELYDRRSLRTVSQTLPHIDTDVHSTESRGVLLECVTPPSSRLSTNSVLPLPPSLTNSISSQGDFSPLSIVSDASSVSSVDNSAEPDLRFGTLTFPKVGNTRISGLRASDVKKAQNKLVSISNVVPNETPLPPTSVTSIQEISPSSESGTDADVEEAEANVLEKTFAHEIMFNKDGQIIGGTLPALIERLTTHDSTPDALFVSTFYLTFRLFATPIGFTQALIDRFEYADDSKRVAGPIKLRVYNVFKGWLESHWRKDCDSPALGLIVYFAANRLSASLPAAGKRLVELATKVLETNSPLVPRLVSSIGKTNTSVAQYVSPETPLPPPIVSKSQLGLLKAWKLGNSSPQLLDFDPAELARQLTIKMSKIFCSILPEELLGTEWTKKSGSIAFNVRTMSTLSTDLANLVADSVLHFEEHSKRAKIIKHWVKIGAKCLELNNYDSLMAIVCSLNSTTISRLRRTWECVSNKTKSTLEELKAVVDCSRNYTALRQRLAILMPPCLPFVGTYLTDLTFVDAGNQSTRILPGSGPDSAISVINFDKHVKTAKIISELQRFQIPYRLQEVHELQTWMQDQFVRVRSSDESSCSPVNSLYRRSCLLEPREQIPSKTTLAMPSTTTGTHSVRSYKRDHYPTEFMGITWKG